MVIGSGGVERVIEFPLDEAEKAMFAKSVASVKGPDRSLQRHRREPDGVSRAAQRPATSVTLSASPNTDLAVQVAPTPPLGTAVQ